MKLFKVLRLPFLHEGRVDKLLLAIFLAINALVLVNSILHDPIIGYDARGHLRYIQVLPERMPLYEETHEFFSAPLPYFLPSLVDKACHALKGSKEVVGKFDSCAMNAGKFAQLINFILSLEVTFIFVKITGVLGPGNRTLKISSLALLGVMTVYYKTFSQVRGEPYLVFFTVWAIYLIMKMIYGQEGLTWRGGIGLGVILGLMVLSRQWGFMLFPAIFGLFSLVWIFDRARWWQFAKPFATSFIVALLICSWFYLFLNEERGSFLAFNRDAQPFSFSNQPATFYRNIGLKNLLLFKAPVRGSFDNRLFPIFYSEMWGDYWGYFVFIQDRFTLGRLGYGNSEQITPYLGRVNAASIFPSLILFGGVLTSAFSCAKLFRSDPAEKSRLLFLAFLLLFLAISFLLYLYFLIVYPTLEQGDNIKATYMLHALIVLPFLGAVFLERLRQRKQLLYTVCVGLLGLVVVHNLPAMITRYWIFLS